MRSGKLVGMGEFNYRTFNHNDRAVVGARCMRHSPVRRYKPLYNTVIIFRATRKVVRDTVYKTHHLVLCSCSVERGAGGGGAIRWYSISGDGNIKLHMLFGTLFLLLQSSSWPCLIISVVSKQIIWNKLNKRKIVIYKNILRLYFTSADSNTLRGSNKLLNENKYLEQLFSKQIHLYWRT